jgi:RNA polymerase sigma-70 factor (family 1)
MALKSLDHEDAILAKIARGDHRAFCILFDHYQRYVYGFGRKLTRSDDQAEEIVQSIFLKLWEARGRLSGIDNFEAYITRLVRNHAYTVLRRNVVITRVNASMSHDVLEVSDLNADLDYRETVGILNEAINSLPEQQRRVYELCHRQGLKYEDAAKEMDISVATVHYHIKLALKTIREHFNRNSFLYPLLISLLFKQK